MSEQDAPGPIVPINEGITASPEHEHLKEKAPDIYVYWKAFDRGAFDKDVYPYTDPAIIKEVVNEVADRLTERATIKGAESFVVPEKFGWEEEAQIATQTTINILAGSRLVDVGTIRAASQYLGPTNTMVKSGFESFFRPTGQFYERFPDRSSRGVLPAGGFERNKLFQLEIGVEGVETGARYVYSHAAEAGIPMSPQAALRIALISNASHEYGHAIDRALQRLGVSTLERSTQHLNHFPNKELLAKDADMVHREHLACGVSRFVFGRYLVAQGYDQEKIRNFWTLEDRRYVVGNKVYDFIKHAVSKGYTPEQVMDFVTPLVTTLKELYGDSVYVWRLEEIIAYHTEPYNDQELAILLER